jgi:hypothetical protein
MRSLAEKRVALLASAGAVAVGVIVCLALVGRWEKDRWVDSQLRGIALVQRLIGPLDQNALTGFRVLPQFDCLVYRRGVDRLALELCIDGKGRVVEAVDRRGGARRYYDLHSDPGDASIHVSLGEVHRLLRKMGAE